MISRLLPANGLRAAARTASILGLAVACLALLGACSGDESGTDDTAEGPSVTAEAETTVEGEGEEMSDAPGPVEVGSGECRGEGTSCSVEPTDNSLIVRVTGETLEGAPSVAVEYWQDGGDRFRSQPAEVTDGRYDIPIARLRAETLYEFEVISMAADGSESAGPGGEFRTGTLPPGLERAEFDVLEGAPTSELTFMDFNPNETDAGPTFHGLIGIDGEGEIVWYASTGETNAMARMSNGDFVFVDYTHGLRRITPLGEEVASLESECVPIVYHHEVEPLPDGSVLTMGFDVRDLFDDEERLQVGDTIVRWDPETGESDEVWRLLDVEDATANRTEASDLRWGFMWTGCDEDLPTEDWSHGNSVKLTPDGGFLVSSRHLNQVHSITSDFSEVNWRLGGHGSDLEFPDPADRFYHQHHVQELENGNVLLFDNGNTRPEEEGGEYSRALELEVDLEAGTAQKAWEYVPEPAIYSPCCASVERLENGNTLMIFPGDIEEVEPCCRVQTIIEADADERTVWKLEARADGLEVVYRVYAGDSILGEQRTASLEADSSGEGASS